MRARLPTTLVIALALASLLWMAPPASAHEGDRYHRHRPYRSESYRLPYYSRHKGWHRHHRTEASRSPYSSRYYYKDGGHRRSDNYSWQYGKNSQKYHKAMHRLARQERGAQERAYRRYEGNCSDPRFRERLAEIDRRYDHKRYQVERNLRNDEE